MFDLVARELIARYDLRWLPPLGFENTYTGVRAADIRAVEAATALGMTPGQVLRLVRLPLAVCGAHELGATRNARQRHGVT